MNRMSGAQELLVIFTKRKKKYTTTLSVEGTHLKSNSGPAG